MTDQNVDKNEEFLDSKDDRVITNEPVKWNEMDEGPSVLSVELPCGYIDKDGNLHDTMVVTEMTGEEEFLLSGKGPVMPRLNQVILNCTKRIGRLTDKKDIADAVSDMTAADRVVALIALRRISLGDYYGVKIRCPNRDCNKESKHNLDLSKIKIVKMEEPMVRNRSDKTYAGKVVNWHILGADDEEWLTSMKKKEDDLLSLGLLARIDSLENVEIEGKVCDFVLDRNNNKNKNGYKNSLLGLRKLLTYKERNQIRNMFNKYEGNVDTEVDIECSNCNKVWSTNMNVGDTGFFFPSDI